MYNVHINWIRAEVHERRFFACTFSTFFYTEQISWKQHIWRDISEWSQIIFKVTWIVWICHHSVQLDLNTVKLTGPLMEKRDHSTKMFIAPMHSWSRNGARCMIPTQIDLILTDTKNIPIFSGIVPLRRFRWQQYKVFASGQRALIIVNGAEIVLL